MTRVEKAAPLLALIRKNESDGAVKAQGVASAYDVVYSGIPKANRPKNALTTYPIREVIEWQRFVVSKGAKSSAAGAYQIIRSALEWLKAGGIFDAACQDGLALQLLDRRGWDDCEAGRMSAVDFADMLSREWASLPVQRDQRGASRQVSRGQSYYAGDGLNKAHAAPEDVLAAVTAALGAPVADPDPVAARFAAIEAEGEARDAEIAALTARLARLEAWQAKQQAFSGQVARKLSGRLGWWSRK